ncbi:hypothetical protein HETIRDRAFT_306596 [Heterobasidion irregulare TC 32-1]|uniref:Uncharacterized protein n=1 Tax=Heterobasidion irregulare (strain TC 32-1) TaxID=747525 RepID=W4KNX9_HETIT|nr:uncharacterized protein HETIRDRAFT_306596 [Heterobasidion irregulare TC 32-1]ETW87095.1 hypothetical protein HETIRDRAFT_306596 [Heterobasidion irregulare TC 32-1]
METTYDAFGKVAETVDFGGEPDYTDFEWFKEPPPERPAPGPPPVPLPPPLPGVIEQNEMIDFALKSAPNVLYGRFKQFGQLGVLGWCAEFSEMIDAVKTLGIHGSMFVTTRTQALRTCEEILQLNLDIKMQIIIIHLSYQISRLRHFLDAERRWEDYPVPDFPLDPQAYPR